MIHGWWSEPGLGYLSSATVIASVLTDSRVPLLLDAEGCALSLPLWSGSVSECCANGTHIIYSMEQVLSDVGHPPLLSLSWSK